MKVVLSDEVREFLRTLAPEPRRSVLRELDLIESGTKQAEPLEEPLEKFYKVKSGRYRMVCAVDANTFYALFAERRSIIYETATAMFLQDILASMRG